MSQSPKEKAKELFDLYHNLIQDIGGDMGHEILVSILAKQSCLIAVDEILEHHYQEQGLYRIDKYYWQKVKKEINNL
jgi:hypothetical protein